MAENTVDAVLIVGQGYVGFPLASLFAHSGVRTVGIESSASRREWCASQHLPNYELSETVPSCVEPVAILVTVGTPLTGGVPDYSAVKEAAYAIGCVVKSGDVVVLESTVAPGTTGGMFRNVIEEVSGLVAGTDFALAFSPERISPAQREDLSGTPKIVGGLTPACLGQAKAVYELAGISVVEASSLVNAEAAKCVENAQRLVTIGLANDLAQPLASLGADPYEVFGLASTKPYGFVRTRPGIGIGGHCITVDSAFLQERFGEAGHSSELLAVGLRLAQDRPQAVASALLGLFGTEATFALLGAAYKPNVGDVRESPALEIRALLDEAGVLGVSVFDPLAEGFRVPSVGELAGFDAVVLLVAHDDWPSDVLELVNADATGTQKSLQIF